MLEIYVFSPFTRTSLLCQITNPLKNKCILIHLTQKPPRGEIKRSSENQLILLYLREESQKGPEQAMAQCHSCFLLKSLPPCPHFLMLTAVWSQGCVFSSGWERDAQAELSATFSWRYRWRGGSGFILVQCRQKGCPRDQGSWCEAPKAEKFKDRYYSSSTSARVRRQGTKLSAGAGEVYCK